jgi:two-component system heavy metal sensor histidine kinase CusS
MLAGLAVTLLCATLAGTAGVGVVTTWRVRRGLQPLQTLARQTQAIAPDRLGERLALAEPVEELQPWIDQFNGLMERLQRAYLQLEAFNADVAHELRTPLANVMGQTEVALSRERPCEALRETLASNLEEMQRLAALVNDMLFLSQADHGRGRAARRAASPGGAGAAGGRVPRGAAGRGGAGGGGRRRVSRRSTSRCSSVRCPTCSATRSASPSRARAS